MRKGIVELLVFLGLIGGGVIALTTIKYSPCDTPLSYHIQTVDTRFNLSREDFTKDAEQASEIWNRAEDKNILELNQNNGAISVNLIFDNRAQLTNQINNLENNLDNQKGTLDEQIVQYRQAKVVFEKKLSDLNAQIEYWNSKGGAPADEYNKLVAQQRELKEEAQTLNNTAKRLNQTTDLYNSQVGQLDTTIQTFNQTLFLKPEEGLWDGKTRTITIYFDNSQNELTHTLAHEFGHALGLEHNDNKLSIMYPYSTTRITPSQNDLSDLELICKKRSLFDIGQKRLQLAILNLQQQRR